MSDRAVLYTWEALMRRTVEVWRKPKEETMTMGERSTWTRMGLDPNEVITERDRLLDEAWRKSVRRQLPECWVEAIGQMVPRVEAARAND